MSQNEWSNSWEVLNDWHRSAGLARDAHYDSARQYANRNYWLGIPVIIFSTFVGTSIFATLQDDVNPWIRVFIGVVSVASAILAGLQTFLRFAESAERHHGAAVKYDRIWYRYRRNKSIARIVARRSQESAGRLKAAQKHT